MTAECTCGHPQSQHKGGKQGCRGCDLGCGRFEPETADQPAVEPVPAQEPTAPTELTDDHLTRALADLARTRLDLGDYIIDHSKNLTDLLILRREHGVTLQEKADLGGELNDVRGELATEAEAHRETQAEANRLGAELGKARELCAELEKEHASLSGLLERVEHAAGADPDDPFQSLERLVAEHRTAAQHGADALLDRADATKALAIVGISTTIRDLLIDLREQLAEHDRLDDLRAELARVEQRASEIRAELAAAAGPEAVPPPPDRVVREWARANGFDVDVRGRISTGVRAAYMKAHSTESAITEGAPTA